MTSDKSLDTRVAFDIHATVAAAYLDFNLQPGPAGAARVGGITWVILGVDHCLRESISCCLYIVSLGLFYYDLDLCYYSGKFTLKVKEPIGMLLSS